MAFTYAFPIPDHQETPTFGSKTVLVKSTLVDIALGSGGTTATDYPLGIVLPKEAQVVLVTQNTLAAAAGASVTAATLEVKTALRNITGALNVFVQTGTVSLASPQYPVHLNTTINKDYSLFYRLTLSGGGTEVTTGRFIITVFYVI